MLKNIFKKVGLVALLVGAFFFTQIFSAQAGLTSGQYQIGTTSGYQQLTGGGQMQYNGPCTSVYDIHGQLWSSSVGYIYLNCADGASSTDFGVQQDNSGNWNGYGWSPEIGWVKFGGVGCPPGMYKAAGANSCDVQLLSTTVGTGPNQAHQIVGWARACSLAADPIHCSGGPVPNGGGADGWISMSGQNDQDPNLTLAQTSNKYGTNAGAYELTTVTSNQQAIKGYVWNSDDIGWARFDTDQSSAYYVPTNVVTANLYLSANPTTVIGNTGSAGVTTLKYYTDAASIQYFTTGNCVGSASPTGADTTWENSNLPNLASTNTPPDYAAPAIGNSSTHVQVLGASTTYTITCPVSIQTGTFMPAPNQTQPAVSASVTVTRGTPQPTVSVGTHDLCQRGSVNTNLLNTTLSWIGGTGTTSCDIYEDGSLILSNQATLPPNNTYTVGGTNGYSQSTSSYSTPQSGTSFLTHKFYAICKDGTNATYTSDPVYVGVAPTTFNGTAGNSGNVINCTQLPDVVSLDGGGPLCTSNTANDPLQNPPTRDLTIKVQGPDAASYTYCKIKNNGVPTTNSCMQNGSCALTYNGTYSSAIYTAAAYGNYTAECHNGSTITTSPIQSMGINGGSCYDLFTTSSTDGALCPAHSPASVSWTAPTATCTMTPPGTTVTPSGNSFTYNAISSTGAYTANCTYPDATHISHTWNFSVYQATDPICTAVPGTSTQPVIKEQ